MTYYTTADLPQILAGSKSFDLNTLIKAAVMWPAELASIVGNQWRTAKVDLWSLRSH